MQTLMKTLALGAALASLTASPSHAEARTGTCDIPTQPVIALGFGSRYTDESVTRADIDPEGNAEVDRALRPVDDFIRDVVREANRALRRQDPVPHADCAVAALARWARADALSELRSMGANISAGARLAGFALAYAQVRPLTTRTEDLATIDAWLVRLSRQQARYWVTDATSGARQGNLRAWASLGIGATAMITGDTSLLAAALAGRRAVLCTAAPDGSLPQEMKRGRFALHYQLHAVAPLVMLTALVAPAGHADLSDCDEALPRAVAFTLADLDRGEATRAKHGYVQSFFDGSETLGRDQLAWLVPWVELAPDPAAIARLAELGTPYNSKLGGNQAVFWAHPTAVSGF